MLDQLDNTKAWAEFRRSGGLWSEVTKSQLGEVLARRAATDAAHERANKAALLEPARMGCSVSEWRDGQIVWITPEENLPPVRPRHDR